MKDDEIEPYIGLWQQQDINIRPYNGMEMFRDWKLAKQRDKLKLLLHNATFIAGKITLEENKKITVMIDSDDEDNLYMAEQIIKFKSNGPKRTFF